MNERLKLIRGESGLSQGDFGKNINLSRSHISSLENGAREITDRIISDICREFNVNEEWFRNGTGEMFIQTDTFSLNEKARMHNLSEIEIDIMKDYMELTPVERKQVMEMMKVMFPKLRNENSSTAEISIDEEVENYRRELQAEEKGATLSVLPERNGKSV